jgi:DNA-binding HxlR family transcriptional regulator
LIAASSSLVSSPVSVTDMSAPFPLLGLVEAFGFARAWERLLGQGAASGAPHRVRVSYRALGSGSAPAPSFAGLRRVSSLVSGVPTGTRSVLHGTGGRGKNVGMATTYGEYCPIAVGAEVFADRWTPLVLRELMLGSRRFNDIHRGLPKMNRTLLVQRLRSLERRALVERRCENGGRTVDYVLTESGRELQPIVWSLGEWAARWTFGDPADSELDVAWLVWRLHQKAIPSVLPEGRLVVEFVASGPGGGNAWLVFDDRRATACEIDPGYDVDLVVEGDNRELHRWMLGVTPYREMVRAGAIRLVGPSRLVRGFPKWFDIVPLEVVAAGSGAR